jgi:hypothetical protein
MTMYGPSHSRVSFAAVLVALDEAKHIALGHLLEGPNQIEPPNREWPCDGDRLECLGW